jgi:YfiH family protein
LDFIRPDWPAPATVHAAMTTRTGGVSTGPFQSLNLGIGHDEPRHVLENRRRVHEALALPAEPGWLKQVHGVRVVNLSVGRHSHAADPVEADASYTTDPGVVCVVQAADCLPVLLCDDRGSIVAAAHAGWRGLAAGVLEATVRALPVKPASLMAWLGAAIGPRSFEVGSEVRDAFVAADSRAAAAFVGGPAPGKFLADLYALARQRLSAAGVRRVSGGGLDTLREPARFFSHRRDGRCGRMAALVWLAR